MAFIILVSFMLHFILVQGRTEVERFAFSSGNYTHLDIYANALARAHYNPWMCNYRSEPGYKCISCSAALHCFPANFALLVQCSGLLPFCRYGYCSRFKSDGCAKDYIFAEGTHGPLRLTTSSSNSSILPEESTTSETLTQVLDEGGSMVEQSSDANKVEEVTSPDPKPNTDKDPRKIF